MSHIEQQRDKFNLNRRLVMEMLNWDELRYAEFQEERGIEYLRAGLQLDEFWIKSMTHNLMFWKWWINEWNLMDEHTFLPNARLMSNLEGYYSRIHGHNYLNSYPDKDTFEESYARMIGDCFDLEKSIIKEPIKQSAK